VDDILLADLCDPMHPDVRQPDLPRGTHRQVEHAARRPSELPMGGRRLVREDAVGDSQAERERSAPVVDRAGRDAVHLPEHRCDDTIADQMDDGVPGEAVRSELPVGDQLVAQRGDAHDLSQGDHAHARTVRQGSHTHPAPPRAQPVRESA